VVRQWIALIIRAPQGSKDEALKNFTDYSLRVACWWRCCSTQCRSRRHGHRGTGTVEERCLPVVHTHRSTHSHVLDSAHGTRMCCKAVVWVDLRFGLSPLTTAALLLLCLHHRFVLGCGAAAIRGQRHWRSTALTTNGHPKQLVCRSTARS
jgi:hypothetical protein